MWIVNTKNYTQDREDSNSWGIGVRLTKVLKKLCVFTEKLLRLQKFTYFELIIILAKWFICKAFGKYIKNKI